MSKEIKQQKVNPDSIRKVLKKTETDDLGVMYNLISDELENRKVFDSETDIHIEDLKTTLETLDDEEFTEWVDVILEENDKRKLEKYIQVDKE